MTQPMFPRPNSKQEFWNCQLLCCLWCFVGIIRDNDVAVSTLQPLSCSQEGSKNTLKSSIGRTGIGRWIQRGIIGVSLPKSSRSFLPPLGYNKHLRARATGLPLSWVQDCLTPSNPTSCCFRFSSVIGENTQTVPMEHFQPLI